MTGTQGFMEVKEKFTVRNSAVKKRLVSLFLVALALAQPVQAGRSVSALPWSESFNADNYSDLVWVTEGATHTWLPTGGWNGSGGAKFTPPNAQGYSGIGQVLLGGGLRPTQLNVRFLIYHGRTWSQVSGGGKLVILNREGNRDRPMLIYGEYPENFGANAWDSIAPCNGTVCRHEGGDYWPNGRETFRIGNGKTGRSHEWICVEIEADARKGVIKLYIDVPDRKTVTLETSTSTGGTFTMMDILGGYLNRGNARPDAENYFVIDELAMSTSRIGPPDGFRKPAPARPR
jgi:hypothetical protein